MRLDLTKLIGRTGNLLGLRVLGIRHVNWSAPRQLQLQLTVDGLLPPPLPATNYVTIHCGNVADYLLRPKDPNTIEGGPLIALHDQHELLGSLAAFKTDLAEPGVAPIHFRLLELDQSYVIAERLELEAEETTRVG